MPPLIIYSILPKLRDKTLRVFLILFERKFSLCFLQRLYTYINLAI